MKRGFTVARFTRAWIETVQMDERLLYAGVARFTRAWIETGNTPHPHATPDVARFTRAWIETKNPLISVLT